MKTKRLVILGSTGSIGRQTLDVVREQRDRFKVVGLAAGRNATLLEEQAREFKPRVIWSSRDKKLIHVQLMLKIVTLFG